MLTVVDSFSDSQISPLSTVLATMANSPRQVGRAGDHSRSPAQERGAAFLGAPGVVRLLTLRSAVGDGAGTASTRPALALNLQITPVSFGMDELDSVLKGQLSNLLCNTLNDAITVDSQRALRF